MGAHSLTRKQRAFIEAYVSDPKLTQKECAIRAGCSVKRAKTTASEWLRHPVVKLEIERRLANKLQCIEGEFATKLELTPESVIQELDHVRELCLRADPGSWQCVLLLRVAALKGRHLHMFTEQEVNEVEQADTGPIRIVFVNGNDPNPGPAQQFIPLDDKESSRVNEGSVVGSEVPAPPASTAEAKPTPPPEPPPLPLPQAECTFHGVYPLPSRNAPRICPQCKREAEIAERKLLSLMPARWA